MTEAEIKDWLGISANPRPLCPGLLEAMAEVPVPEDDQGHIRAYRAFLEGAPGEPGARRIFADQDTRAEAEAVHELERRAAIEAQDQAADPDAEAECSICLEALTDCTCLGNLEAAEAADADAEADRPPAYGPEAAEGAD
jgi:hypothetical protein